MKKPSLYMAASVLIVLGAVAWIAPGGFPQQVQKRVASLDFSSGTLPADWSVSTKKWKVEDGELLGEGSGALEFKREQDKDFTLIFDAWTEEKANIEVLLVSPDGKRTYYVFAFLGKYHPVLDGVKCAILKDNRFVSIEPRMWIFPGRFFSFEVRRAKKTVPDVSRWRTGASLQGRFRGNGRVQDPHYMHLRGSKRRRAHRQCQDRFGLRDPLFRLARPPARDIKRVGGLK